MTDITAADGAIETMGSTGDAPWGGGAGAGTQVAILKALCNALAAVSTDTSPVAVTANPRAGLGTLIGYGSPNVAADNVISRSNPFIPNGEKISLELAYYATGFHQIDWAGGGAFWLEADLSSGTMFKVVHGSLRQFSQIDRPVGDNSFVLPYCDIVRPFGNWRLAINFGVLNASAGGTGNVGFNVYLLN